MSAALADMPSMQTHHCRRAAHSLQERGAPSQHPFSPYGCLQASDCQAQVPPGACRSDQRGERRQRAPTAAAQRRRAPCSTPQPARWAAWKGIEAGRGKAGEKRRGTVAFGHVACSARRQLPVAPSAAAASAGLPPAHCPPPPSCAAAVPRQRAGPSRRASGPDHQ